MQLKLCSHHRHHPGRVESDGGVKIWKLCGPCGSNLGERKANVAREFYSVLPSLKTRGVIKCVEQYAEGNQYIIFSTIQHDTRLAPYYQLLKRKQHLHMNN